MSSVHDGGVEFGDAEPVGTRRKVADNPLRSSGSWVHRQGKVDREGRGTSTPRPVLSARWELAKAGRGEEVSTRHLLNEGLPQA